MPSPSKYYIKAASFTDPGDREVNEDYKITEITPKYCAFAVADGLGGHGMGDLASKSVCETVAALLREGETEEDALYDKAQTELLKQQNELGAKNKMRTTLNLLLLRGGMAYISHIGDTRTYYFRSGELVKRTRDHSVPQMLALTNQIDESMIRFHEDRNRLLRAMGVADKGADFDAEDPVLLEGDQQFLLCTDGFWEYITEEQMLYCLRDAETPQSWLDSMLELVRRNQKGHDRDNFTAVAVWIRKNV